MIKKAKYFELIYLHQNSAKILVEIKHKIKSLPRKEQKVLANSMFGMRRKKFLRKIETNFISLISFSEICEFLISYEMQDLLKLIIENKDPAGDLK